MPRIKERRRRKRISVALPIKLEYNKEKIFTETKNISVLGTYIEVEKSIPAGTILDIEIEIPEEGLRCTKRKRQIGLTGVTFRCQPIVLSESQSLCGIGIFFRSFLGDGEELISDYIDYVLQREQKAGRRYIRKRKQE